MASSCFNEEDRKGLEHSLHNGAKLLNRVFGDEMLPYATGPSYVNGGTESHTFGDGRKHATNAGNSYSRQRPLPVDRG
jgi:hypothetical protein